MHEVLQGMREGNSAGTTEAKITLPFSIHPSHTAVHIGGFVVYLKCGSTRRCDAKGNVLRAVCRGWCPKNTKAVLERTLNGKHPNGQGGKWPDGSTSPTLSRLGADAYSA